MKRIGKGLKHDIALSRAAFTSCMKFSERVSYPGVFRCRMT
jgi:hypothetical protein